MMTMKSSQNQRHKTDLSNNKHLKKKMTLLETQSPTNFLNCPPSATIRRPLVKNPSSQNKNYSMILMKIMVVNKNKHHSKLPTKMNQFNFLPRTHFPRSRKLINRKPIKESPRSQKRSCLMTQTDYFPWFHYWKLTHMHKKKNYPSIN